MRRLWIIMVFSVLMVMLSSVGSYAQADQGGIMLQFRMNEYTIDPKYKENAKVIESIENLLKQDIVGYVSISVSSSPDGPYASNERLARNRAKSIAALFEGRIAPELLDITVIPENWDGIVEMIEDSYTYSDKGEILEILNNTEIDYDERERRLRALNYGSTWRYMCREYLPKLRSASMIRLYREAPSKNIRIYPQVKSLSSLVVSHRQEPQIKREKRSAPVRERDFVIAFRSNLLYDLALVPNIGVEFHLGKGWSLGLDYNHAWWNLPGKNYYWRILGGGLDFRKYFGKITSSRPLSGHHIGLYAQAFTYDIELGGRGQISDLTYSGGLEYGYSLPLGDNFNIDFGAGFGFAGGEYKVYDPEDGCYVWKETRQRYYYGPTKGEISLVWIIGHKKGGKR